MFTVLTCEIVIKKIKKPIGSLWNNNIKNVKTLKMSVDSLEKRNQKIRERILNFSEIRFVPYSPDSSPLKPVRMKYVQDNKTKIWDLMKVPESVMIITFNITRKKLIMVKQFRPAVYFSCLPDNEEVPDLQKYPPSLGITLELCAGIVDKNKSLVEIAQDELLEECGYKAPISAFEQIITYKSVGSSAGNQTLYYVEVTDDMDTHLGGGLDSEGELIEVVEMSVDEVKKYIASDDVQSPPHFLFGISWFLQNKKDRYS